MAIEWEIALRKPFYKSLSVEEKAAFDELMDACRNVTLEASNACKPILFQPMIMSIILHHQKALIVLEKKINEAKNTSP